MSWQWLQLCISPPGPAATIKHRTESGGPVTLEVESRLMTSTTKSSEEWTRILALESPSCGLPMKLKALARDTALQAGQVQSRRRDTCHDGKLN